MAERIEPSKRFPALLFLQVSNSVGIIPAGFLSEWTLYPRALLSDNGQAGAVYHRGPAVPDRIHYGELSCDSASESDRPERLPAALLRNGSSAKGEPARSAGPQIWDRA